ncbi:MAG: hypothetical protein JWM65_417 [Sphingomonas bacterium]|nr:hypothetical protein [Sphingomonas bacterium]
MTRNLMVLASGLALAACGSGGSTPTPTPSSSTPTPTPATPTPSPSSSPTPTPSYPTFASLTGDQSFSSACAALAQNTSVPTVLPATNYGQGLTFAYQASTFTWTISGDFTQSFGPAERDPTAPTGFTGYLKGNGSATDRFFITQPSTAGTGLDYLRQTYVLSNARGYPVSYYCVVGVPTHVSDVPAATTVTFTHNGLVGSSYDTSSGTMIVRSLVHSTVTFTVNLTTLHVDTSVHLMGTPQAAGSSDVDLGTITGSGTLDPATGGFYGAWSSTDREAIGNFGGTFFGPQGAEFSYAFSFGGRNSSAVAIFAAQGMAFGRR